jgi:hypothetical protein
MQAHLVFRVVLPRPVSSAVQVRTKETKAAFVAEYAPKPGTPICHAADPERMIDALSASSGGAFCTVKYVPPRVQVELLVKGFRRRFCE